MEKAYFENIRQNILDEINKAEKEIKVAVCWFTNQQLFDALCKKRSDGISVELIILNDFINNREDGLDFQYFIDIGGVFCFGENDKPMHNKYCIIDNNVLINGSYNWTYYAESKNEENVIIHFDKTELIEAFEQDFERIKSKLQIVTKIVKNSSVEQPKNNFFGYQNYLSQDYLFKAKEIKDFSTLEKAFKLLPNSINIQKQASEFNIVTKKILNFQISTDTQNGSSVLIPKGTEIPCSGMEFFTTVNDNQSRMKTIIRYGDNPNSENNIRIGLLMINELPHRPAGEVEIMTSYKIDIYGFLHITDTVLENNHKKEKSFNVKHLLKEI